MEFIKQNGTIDNAVSALKNLALMMDLKVSTNAYNEVVKHPQYPSVIALIVTLKEWRVESIGVQLGIHQLKDIPYPAIAYLRNNNGHFVVLQKWDYDYLCYIDSEIGAVRETISDFQKKWTGVVLLVEANERSGEVGYEEKRKKEVFYQWSHYIVWMLSVIFLILPSFVISISVVPYYLLKIVGAAFCFLLVQKQLGVTSKAVDAFCGLGSKSNCDEVIHSPGSKLFGVISLSEIGALYFAGGILTLMISAFAGISTSSLMVTLTVLLLPFTLVSVYYQWRIVKAWCPLCLVVMLIIWLEVLFLVPVLSSVSFEIKSLVISGLGFSLPLIFWLSIRERFMDSYRLPNLERTLYRFTRSKQVFQSLLYKQPKIDLGNFSHEIKTGNAEAPVTITLVSNPNCGPCSAAHAAVEDLLERFENKIKVNFRFTLNPNEPESNSTKVVKHLIALSLTDSKNSLQALSSWYLQGGRIDINQWMSKYTAPELDGEKGKVNQILSEHANWCLRVGITATPTLFINGMKYPEEYTLSDLKFQIRNLLDSITDRAPEKTS